MITTRSLMCRTTLRSWLIKRYVRPSAACKSMNRFSTCAWMETSSAATDSSQTMNSGLTARGRKQTDRQPSERRLAAPRFADQADNLPIAHRHVDAVDGVNDLLTHVRTQQIRHATRHIEGPDEPLGDRPELEQRRLHRGGVRAGFCRHGASSG